MRLSRFVFLASHLALGSWVIEAQPEERSPLATSVSLISARDAGVASAGTTGKATIRSVVRNPQEILYIAGEYSGVLTAAGNCLTNANHVPALFALSQDPAGKACWLQTSDPGLAYQGLVPGSREGAFLLALFRGPMTNHFGEVSVNSTSSWGVVVMQLGLNGAFGATTVLSTSRTNVTRAPDGSEVAPFAIAQARCDRSGNLVLAGNFQEHLTVGGANLHSGNDSQDINYFVAKVRPDGTTVWACQGGSTLADELFDAALDQNDNLFVTIGYRGESNVLGTTTWSAPAPAAGMAQGEGLVLKLTPAGEVAWGRRASQATPGFYRDFESVRSDGLGGCYVVGRWSAGPSPDQQLFVARYDATGNLCWVRPFENLESSQPCQMFGLPEVDGAGNLYLAGQARSRFSLSGRIGGQAGGNDVFLAKLSRAGDVQWLRSIATAGNDEFLALDTDIDGNCFVLGLFGSELRHESNHFASRGADDLFFTKIDLEGRVAWTLQAGGQDFDWGSDVVADGVGGAIFSGVFSELVYIGDTTVAAPGSNHSFVAHVGRDPGTNAPVVAVDPASQVVRKGNPVMLGGAVLGSRPLVYQWLKDGEAIPGATKPTLEIPSVTRRDAATYSLLASNKVGSTSSSGASLRIQSPQRLATPMAQPGSRVKFTFADADGEPIGEKDVPFLEVQISSNLTTDGWSTVHIPFSVESGKGVFYSTNSRLDSKRFYRLLQK